MLAVRDINTNPDVTCKQPILIESWYADVKNPAILSVVMTQPILHFELLSPIKRLHVDVKATLQVVCVYTFRPTISKLFFHGSPSEIQPRLVEVGAEFVRPRHPDQHRRGVRDQPEALFAFLKSFLG